MRAVIPAGGFGTRMLPATKSMPKEMMPVVDKPTIQYVVEEAVAAGIRDIAIISGRTKRAVEDHFDRAAELEQFLESKGKTAELEIVRAVQPDGRIIFIRQDWPRGLGHAVLQAAPVVEGGPFAVLLGDDILVGPESVTAQLVKAYEERNASVIAVQRVPRSELSRYGVVRVEGEGPVRKVVDIIEKPSPDEAPSDLAVIGRYVFTPGIIDQLRSTEPGVGGEIQLTDAIRSLLESEEVYCLEFEARRFDVGEVRGWLEANVALALARPSIASDVAAMLRRELDSVGL